MIDKSLSFAIGLDCVVYMDCSPNNAIELRIENSSIADHKVLVRAYLNEEDLKHFEKIIIEALDYEREYRIQEQLIKLKKDEE